MRYGQLREWRDRKEIADLIDDVIVIRIRRAARPQKRGSLYSESKFDAESNFRYVLIFEPRTREGLVPKATDYFLYRDSKKWKHFRRDFRALHTVANTIAKWGLRRFTYLDLSRDSDESAAREIQSTMAKRRKPYKILMDALQDYPLTAVKPQRLPL